MMPNIFIYLFVYLEFIHAELSFTPASEIIHTSRFCANGQLSPLTQVIRLFDTEVRHLIVVIYNTYILQDYLIIHI